MYTMRRVITVSLFLFLSISAYPQLDKMLDQAKKAVTTGDTKGLTQDEVVRGLKEALTNGTNKSADLVSKVDGYFKNPEIKIPFPPDVKHVEDKLRQMGMGAQVDKFVLALNRGAEDAAKQSAPIFVNAVKQMTIQDGFTILKGAPDAATQYLQKNTTAELKTKFKPVIQTSLDKVSATKYYGELVTTYNKIPFVTKVNPDLNEYATDKAIQGLFVMIAKEEKNIRANPVARTTDILKKVFGAQ
jgi:hypothetical protein